MEEEFVEADRATRLKVFGLLGVAIILLFGAEPFFNLISSKNETLATTDPVRALKNSTDLLLIVILVSAAVSWGLSIHFLRIAVKVKRSGRCPAPGMHMAFRTKVRRGKCAVCTWVVLFAVSGIFMIKPFFDFYVWYTISRLSSELSLPNKQMP